MAIEKDVEVILSRIAIAEIAGRLYIDQSYSSSIDNAVSDAIKIYNEVIKQGSAIRGN